MEQPDTKSAFSMQKKISLLWTLLALCLLVLPIIWTASNWYENQLPDKQHHEFNSVLWVSLSMAGLFSVLVYLALSRHTLLQHAVQEEQRYRGVVDNISIGVSLLSPGMEILYLNKQMKDWFPDIDVSRKPVCYKVFNAPPREAICSYCPTCKTLQDGNVHESVTETQSSEGVRNYRVVASPLRDTKGEIIAAIELVEDITNQRTLESQLAHARKLESIGTLASGVAHDFNNILTAIIGFASVLKRRLPENDPLKLYAEQILLASDKASHLTSSLLMFSRKQTLNLTPAMLNEIIRKLETFLSRIIGEDIEFRTILADEELIVMADFSQMEQVLMNLAANARDAMPSGGILTIRIESAIIDDAFIRLHGFGAAGKYALVAISDTGTGFDEETKQKIFEPFFTTKEVDKGTGLGLSIVYGIIKQHKGYIVAESGPGKGTTFKIYLPMVTQTAKEVIEKKPEQAGIIRGSETILIAEDDMTVRDLISFVLKDSGYNIIAAENGEDAVIKFIENEDAIQLVILDLIMPKKSGRDAVNEIRKLNPDIKGFFLSGYGREVPGPQDNSGNGMEIISKPVKPDHLLRKVREALDGKL